MSKPTLYIDVIFTGVKHPAGTSSYVLYVGRATIIWIDGIRSNILLKIKSPDYNTAMDKVREYCTEYARQGADANEDELVSYNGHWWDGVEIDTFDDYVYNHYDIPHYINYEDVQTHVEIDARTLRGDLID